MNLLLVLALKRIHDDQQAAARRRSRAREEARRKKNAPKDHAHRYSSREYSENEYFNMVVTEDEVLTAFFDALEKKGKQIDDKDAEEVRKVVEEKLKLQAERVDEINKTLAEIKATGLELVTDQEEYFNYKTTVGRKVLDACEPAFGEKGEYAKVKKSFQLAYKGITLDRAWFRADRIDENPFEVRLTDWEQRNPNLDQEIQEKEVAIEAAEKRLKHAIFGKEEKQDELNKLKKELERLKEAKVDGEKIASQRDIYAEITPEQKALIAKYFDQVDVCKEAGKDVDKDIEKYTQIKGDSYRYSYNKAKSDTERNKWQRALDELIADGDASEELLDAIDTILSEEAIGYEKYSEGKDTYQMQREGHSETFTKLIGWYIDTRREKIATKGLDRREAAYAALAKENNKLLELAGLVDEAKALENPDEKGKKDPKGDGEYGDE